MFKFFQTFFIVFFVSVYSQQTSNRFFYELTFKPNKDKPETEKVLTILDVTSDKSIYQDFTVIAQDSIIKAEVEMMEKSGAWKDMSKSLKMPKFTYKIYKNYPDFKLNYMDRISTKLFYYEDEAKQSWNILPEKLKIGDYNTQKATTEFGGRKWTAWFSTEIPFQDGPYKFHGLPGLIVKLEDNDKNYSWVLQGNKTVNNWEEFSYAEQINAKFGMSNKANLTTKEKFTKSYANFKADPLAEMRPYMTAEFMNRQIPGANKTMGEMIREQEKMIKDFFNGNQNPIEVDDNAAKK